MSVVLPAIKPMEYRVGTGCHRVTEGVSRCPASGILPERPRIQCGYRGTYHTARGVTRCLTMKWPGSCPSCGSGNKPCVRQSRSACNERRKEFELPERGWVDCFPEQKADRARRAYPTGCASQAQKTRRTTACCWAVETPTTGVKAMKGLTRPCADFVESRKRTSKRGASPRRDRACAKTDFFIFLLFDYLFTADWAGMDPPSMAPSRAKRQFAGRAPPLSIFSSEPPACRVCPVGGPMRDSCCWQ